MAVRGNSIVVQLFPFLKNSPVGSKLNKEYLVGSIVPLCFGPHKDPCICPHTQMCKHLQSGTSYCPSFVCTLTFRQQLPLVLYTLSNWGPSPNRGPYCPLLLQVPSLNVYTYQHTHGRTCRKQYAPLVASPTAGHKETVIKSDETQMRYCNN